MIYLGVEDDLPNVILEAVACGTPVLAFNAGAVGDLVENGETGKLVPSGDVGLFTATMAVLLADPKTFSRLGINSCEKAPRQFSEGAVGPAQRQLYPRLSRQRLKLAPDGDPLLILKRTWRTLRKSLRR
jgi:glycosyltransferase involved in cell wall biosynthesis